MLANDPTGAFVGCSITHVRGHPWGAFTCVSNPVGFGFGCSPVALLRLLNRAGPLGGICERAQTPVSDLLCASRFSAKGAQRVATSVVLWATVERV